jgi:hypothetical protein
VIAGTDDFDGDQQNDIVWRNETSGRFVVWHLDNAGNRTFGTFTTPLEPTPIPTDWTIAGPR